MISSDKIFNSLFEVSLGSDEFDPQPTDIIFNSSAFEESLIIDKLDPESIKILTILPFDFESSMPN